MKHVISLLFDTYLRLRNITFKKNVSNGKMTKMQSFASKRRKVLQIKYAKSCSTDQSVLQTLLNKYNYNSPKNIS